MGNGYRVPPSDETYLRDVIQGIQRRLRELEALDGSQIYNTVQELKNLVNGLLTQVNGIFSGYVTAGTTVTAGGNITTPAVVIGAGGVASVGAYNTDITLLPGLRSDLWVHQGGTFGQTVSTITKKMNLGELPFTATDVLAVAPFVFEYIGQVDIRDNPDNPYYDPDYVVPLEVGMMAEHLVERGLGLFVYFEIDGATPRGINYGLFGAVCLLVVGRDHEERLRKLENA